MLDVGIGFLFGLLGYAARKLVFPLVPVVLGMVLGELTELLLRRALTVVDGDVQSAPTPALRMALDQGLGNAIDREPRHQEERRSGGGSNPRAYRRGAGALPRGCVAGTLAASWRLR